MLTDDKIKALCVKHLGWDEPVSDKDLALVKPLFEAQQELSDRECQDRVERILNQVKDIIASWSTPRCHILNNEWIANVPMMMKDLDNIKKQGGVDSGY